MKRIFKKNQVIITTLAILIAVAGYLNYSGELFRVTDESTTEANTNLVNQELLDISEEDLETDTSDIVSNDSVVESTPGEAVLTSGIAEATIAEAKVTREQLRSQNKETLQEIIDNTNLSDAEKSDAVAQMLELTTIAEQEMVIETLMSAKGFTNAVVSLTADTADIVVEAEELTDANIAQIEDIVTRKTEISPENIVITMIHE